MNIPAMVQGVRLCWPGSTFGADPGSKRAANNKPAQDHQDPRQLSKRRRGVEAALSRHQERRIEAAARRRVDCRHGPVRHSVRLAFSGIGAMTKVSISLLIRRPEFGRSASSVKAGLRPSPAAAAALTELAARPLLATMGST